jgi:hypothetical protein
MPQVIQPPGGLSSKPGNTTMIQIGFDYGLNYPFVANNADASEQIFQYLPQGIAYGLGINASDIVMHSLQPYDTSATLGYITTLAMAYIPSEQVDALTSALNTASNQIYDNPNDSTKTLMSLINPMIPLNAGLGIDGSNGSPTATASGMGPGATFNAAPLSDSIVLQTSVRSTSAVIGVGVVAGAAAYGAAMFYIAHRYRRNKRAHRRSSSVQEGSVVAGATQWYGGSSMTGVHPAGMPDMTENARETWFSRGSGGSGGMRSVRDAGISAPISADNSLGWH